MERFLETKRAKRLCADMTQIALDKAATLTRLCEHVAMKHFMSYSTLDEYSRSPHPQTYEGIGAAILAKDPSAIHGELLYDLQNTHRGWERAVHRATSENLQTLKETPYPKHYTVLLANAISRYIEDEEQELVFAHNRRLRNEGKLHTQVAGEGVKIAFDSLLARITRVAIDTCHSTPPSVTKDMKFIHIVRSVEDVLRERDWRYALREITRSDLSGDEKKRLEQAKSYALEHMSSHDGFSALHLNTVTYYLANKVHERMRLDREVDIKSGPHEGISR